ncbi:MAG TPA: sodium/solute symporter [Puia sp.]|uniref:sodium:solute symporter family transporter n=1 Tax=Puia sp. TaxID=2045100 RepID=UPI002BB14870|nr:sodium/solute symporter [Puia sp.]HVU98291.1 sodium/solute symporter [Puia sp.]
MRHLLQPVDLIIIVVYFIVLLAIGYWASFVRKKKANENLFLAERSLGWGSIGLNMWGTNVGPSMLIASASIGYSTGIVAGNFAWYAFVFILLLAVVFAPRYLGAKVSTLPEYMGLRFGESTRTILAWYTLITILISWLSLGLFAGGVLVRQLLGLPMWLSVISMVILATFFTAAGGLKAIAYTNVFQMLLLIAVSAALVYIGITKAGGVHALFDKTPRTYWNLFLPANDKNYPWPAILLGYPVMGVWFWCTEQSMVQSVLGARNLEQGQLGANFIGWLKILDVPLFIVPGVLCFILYPHLKNPDEAYLTLVTQLFPPGMRGLIIVVLVAALVGNIGSSLNSVSTVFTMDIYIKKYQPDATNKEIIRIGRVITVAGAIVSVLITLAIDNIKGLHLFDVFQSVLGFLAPPMSVAFLLGVLWKGATARAINGVLTLGTGFSVAIGILFLWVFPASKYPAWPHFLLLSFFIFVVITLAAVLVSKTGPAPVLPAIATAKPTRRVKGLWAALTIVMIILYILFNGYPAKAQPYIGYPGDYEIWLSNQVQLRRTERGTFFPPFWKLDDHYVLIDFHKTFTIPADDDVAIKAQGRYNVKLDGKMISGTPKRLHLRQGHHTLELKVYNQSTPPALWIKGRYLQTDNTWEVTFEDKEWIDATGKASDKSGTTWFSAEPLPGKDPAHWRLPTEPHRAIHTEKTPNGLLIDFGKESFGYIKLHGLKGRGKLNLYYGESKEEALSTDSCEVLDRLDIDQPNSKDSTLDGSRAVRYVNIQWTGDVRIDSVSLLFEYAPLANKGGFRCSDPAINHIWDVAAYTFHLNTREFFIDGIKRDRWVWSGDAYQSYLMNYYLFFDSATVTRTLWALRGKDPVTSHINTIMDYSFYWFLGVYDYYRYTGDTGFIRLIYPRMVSLMDWIASRRDPDEWLQGQPGDWLFIDWADGLSKKGELSFEQLLYIRSFETLALCADLVNDSTAAEAYRNQSAALREKFFADFWDPHRQAFVHSRIDGKPGDNITRYTNMFAIFFGYLDSAQTQAVKHNVLLNDSIQEITTPYMQFYQLEALCTMGEQPQVLKKIKGYWGGMLANGATSFWEKYDPQDKGAQHFAMYGRPFGRSLCHAWGASPIYLLGKYFLGVRPLTAGYATYEVEPHLGGLQWMEGEVPTPHGNIRISCTHNQVRIHTAEGRGSLRLKKKTIILESNKDYLIKDEVPN